MFDSDSQEMEPQWLEPLTALFGADGSTGWMDSDAALEAMAWLGRRVFEQSRVDRGCHTRGGLENQVVAAQAVANSMSAVQAVRMAQYAATTTGGAGEAGHGAVAPDECVGDGSDARGHGDGEVLHPLGFTAQFADVDLGAAMCWSPGQSTARLEEAIDAVTKTPRLLEQVGAGRLDAYRLSRVTRELVEAGAGTCARVEDELLSAGVTEWTARRVGSRAAGLVRKWDPPAVRKTRKRRARQAIGVFTGPGPEAGTTAWSAVLGSKDAWAAYQAVDRLARELHASTTTGKTLGQCRADAMTDLILGNASVATTVTVLVPVKARPNTTIPTVDDVETEGSDEGGGGVAHIDDVPGERCRAGGEESPGLEELLEAVDWDWELARLIWASRVPGSVADALAAVDAEPEPGYDLDPGSSVDAGRETGDPLPPFQPPCESAEAARSLPDDVEVPGIGVIPGEVVAGMLRSVGASINRALVDQDTGALLGVSSRSYRPTAGIRRQVVLRDVHCRFPGCERPAQFCDADHVLRWPDGPTAVTNLQLLCRHHHRAKHEGGWSVTMTSDGTCTWTSPTGRHYVTRPGLLDVIADVIVTPGSAPARSDAGLVDGADAGPPTPALACNGTG